MNFDERWKIAAAAARRATPETPTEMPLGFATRVVAHWQAQPASSLTWLWQKLALRALGAVFLILVTLAALDLTDKGDRDGWRPEISDAVGESFWML
jgi:hypothetical protein